MPKPIPGVPYIVVPGDTLTRIAKAAYGQASKWTDIYKANQSTLISGDPTLIYPGETLVIPPDPTVEQIKISQYPTLPGKDKDDFTILIDTVEIPVQTGRAFRAIDTVAHGFSVDIAYDPYNPLTREILLPYRYNKAQLFLGGELLINGILYNITPRITNEGRVMTLEAWSVSADMVDSTLKPPYEQKLITLLARTNLLVAPLGLTARIATNALGIPLFVDEPFKKVTADPQEKIFDHLASLAAQRSVLITSDRLGQLVLTIANTDTPVGTIEESVPPGTTFEVTFDGRKRYSIYKVLAQSPGRKNKARSITKSAFSIDTSVPRSRFITFQADDAEAKDLQRAADWKRSKQVAEALTISLPVDSWYDPSGNLWEENKLVNVKSDTIFLPAGFIFLIKSVEYIFTEGGTTAVLNLVPPNVYTGLPVVEPWIAANPPIEVLRKKLTLLDQIEAALESVF